jgi:hypothetical protein
MTSKIATKGIRVRVLRQLILLNNTLYERYEVHDWKGSNVPPDFKNYLWTVVNVEDIMDILGCSKRTAHDYLTVLKIFVQ